MSKLPAYNGDKPFIFVSYSHNDPQVPSFLQELYQNQYRFWYDEGIASGRIWADTIAHKIKCCSQFLVFLSRNAVASDNVLDEVALAVKYRRELLVVHLEDNIPLPGGLELQIDRRQALFFRKYNTSFEFIRFLLGQLKGETCEQASSVQEDAFFERYELLSPIHDSMLGQSFVGIQKSLNLPVFVKRYSNLSSNSGRFVRGSCLNEIGIYKMLSDCPFLPRLLDFYDFGDTIYLVLSFLHGRLLSKELAQRHFTSTQEREEWAIDLVKKLAHILDYLHNNNPPIIHRDIKPDNLFLNDRGDLFLFDFGISVLNTPDNPDLQVAMGTKGYAAPEQYYGNCSPQSDLYAAGCTFIDLLTGTTPHDRKSTGDWNLIRNIDPNFDPVLEEIVLKMTAAQPEDRYSSAAELLTALDRCRNLTEKQRLQARRRSRQRCKESINQSKTQVSSPFDRLIRFFKSLFSPSGAEAADSGSSSNAALHSPASGSNSPSGETAPLGFAEVTVLSTGTIILDDYTPAPDAAHIDPTIASLFSGTTPDSSLLTDDTGILAPLPPEA